MNRILGRSSADVRLAPKATESPYSSEMTLSANNELGGRRQTNRHRHCGTVLRLGLADLDIS
jgi:hypothetical protein